MGNVIDIDSARPHQSFAITCKCCGSRWIAVAPINTNKYECPGCSKYVNQYGTEVTVKTCNTCGREFTICPAIAADAEGWDDCLDDYCASYDPERDPSDLFDG